MNPDSSPNRSYSPFWALAPVFAALLAGYAIQLWGLAGQNRQMRQADASLVQALPRAVAVTAKLQAVGKDLVDLAPSSAAARQIVNEFEIRLASSPP